MTGPDGVASPVHAAVVPAIGVAASEGHPTHDELVAVVAAIVAVGRTSTAAAAGPASADWRCRRLAALGLAPRRRP